MDTMSCMNTVESLPDIDRFGFVEQHVGDVQGSYAWKIEALKPRGSCVARCEHGAQQRKETHLGVPKHTLADLPSSVCRCSYESWIYGTTRNACWRVKRLPLVLLGHRDWIWSVEFLPDEK
ncbi:hypothetical protein BS17DRAFT_477951 [Gyrodon lividus]|nr:hypothetical protein BS17DRAFT_477951 [Gyrodon lividus]